MNKFIKTIRETPDYRNMVLDMLKSSELPLIMYGAGMGALSLKKYLDQKGIQINDCFSSDNYVDLDNKNNLMQQKVKTFKGICASYTKFNVILGLSSDVPEAKKNIENWNSNQVNSIFSFDTHYIIGDVALDIKYFEDNIENFLKVYNLLEDEFSRETFRKFIQAKLSGDCNYLNDIVVREPYFQACAPLTKNEVFVDGGAYAGDTLSEFLKKTNGNYDKYYGFEPDEQSFELLKKFINDQDLKNIEIFKKGIGKKKQTLNFNSTNTRGSFFSENGTTETAIDYVDNLCSDATFIKMDVEGFELEALKGAKNTIIQNKPKLAICVYHKVEDIFEIPLYIKSLVPEYQFFLRQHAPVAVDIILYGIYKG